MGSSPLLPYDLLKPQEVIMVVPDSVKEKVGQMPDIASMSKEDLEALVKQLYDQSCAVFGEKFHMEYAVKKRDMEIHNLEMETSASHGTFKIPKLKKANKFKMMGDEEEAKQRENRMHEGEKPGSFGIKISQCLLPAIGTSWQSNLT